MSDLPAGKEIDQLIAERVMRWTRRVHHPDDFETPAGEVREVGTRNPYGDEMGHFNPSAEIRDAWEVVEKLREYGEHGCSVAIENECVGDDGRIGWQVTVLERGEGHVRADADTAPLAICRAALKAVS